MNSVVYIDVTFVLDSERVAPYKRLRGGVQFVPTIPKTSTGKILRREIKAALATSKM